MKEEISTRIKELRKKNGFSQNYVAKRLFISQAAYSLIENSQNGIGAEHILKLSKLYMVTTDYLLKGDKQLIKMSSENGFIPPHKS
ncbi:helix-turn-helix domain-containing protein [Zunongwangia sp. H14]|uniref:helix-turn-helix domain-containing protein n=1 Tax=Zunongwangia sp. H14 TaxID=3240792 RepID=UPI0035644BF9